MVSTGKGRQEPWCCGRGRHGWKNAASAGSPPPPQRVLRCARFQNGGRALRAVRRRIQEVFWRAPRPVTDGSAAEAGANPDPARENREGWLGATSRRMRPECGAEVGKASSSRRRRPRRPVRSCYGPRCFSGKERELFARFSRKGPWVLWNKKPTSGWKWASDAVLLAPQFFHFPYAQAARFVVVTWLICQEETACRRTKARVQSIVWIAGADIVCIEQFMEFGLCGKCANSVWSPEVIGTSAIFFKGYAKVFLRERFWARLRARSGGTIERNKRTTR